MDGQFTEVSDRIHSLEDKFSTLQSAADGIAKQIMTYHQEMVAFTHRVDNMENGSSRHPKNSAFLIIRKLQAKTPTSSAWRQKKSLFNNEKVDLAGDRPLKR